MFLSLISPPPTDDQTLLNQIQQGGSVQESAIRQLYQQYFHLALEGRKKYPQLNDDELVSAYNSAILSVRKQIVLGNFRGDSTLWTYLNRIFINRCIDLIRKRSSNKEETRETLPEDLEKSWGAFTQIERKDDFEQLLQQMNHLGEPCKQIILDAEYYGYSSEEIAQRVGFSNARSVNSKKYTCLQRLRKMLAA